MTTVEELSGVFNVLIKDLNRVLKNGIFVREKTIELRREKHELAVNPIGCFLREAIAEDSVESDKIIKEELYLVYKRFCNEHELAVESEGNFGKILKNKINHGFQEGREATGQRRRFWKGVMLAEKYNIAAGQLILEM